jgi:hypothetical protein
MAPVSVTRVEATKRASQETAQHIFGADGRYGSGLPCGRLRVQILSGQSAHLFPIRRPAISCYPIRS